MIKRLKRWLKDLKALVLGYERKSPIIAEQQTKWIELVAKSRPRALQGHPCECSKFTSDLEDAKNDGLPVGAPLEIANGALFPGWLRRWVTDG